MIKIVCNGKEHTVKKMLIKCPSCKTFLKFFNRKEAKCPQCGEKIKLKTLVKRKNCYFSKI